MQIQAVLLTITFAGEVVKLVFKQILDIPEIRIRPKNKDLPIIETATEVAKAMLKEMGYTEPEAGFLMFSIYKEDYEKLKDKLIVGETYIFNLEL